MRTTVDLPPAVHRRARELAAERGVSLSAVLVDLTMRGLAHIEGPPQVGVDERSGFPLIRLGHPVTVDEVAAMLDDE